MSRRGSVAEDRKTLAGHRKSIAISIETQHPQVWMLIE
jgi:hypothetical protein